MAETGGIAETSVKERKGKVFQDSVHGSIEFDEFLVKIIDSVPFQRMRNIKQMGVTSLVYPGAVHTRFEHSLGTCYLARQMLDAIERNTHKKIMEKIIAGCKGQETIKDIKINDCKEWNQYKRCVEVAALCHDLGHGPFSHVWDDHFLVRAESKGGDSKVPHEETSMKIVKLTLLSLGKDADIMDLVDKMETLKEDDTVKEEIGEHGITIIQEMIAGEKTKGEKIHNCPQFLYEIVSNKATGIDVDKWDYFMRDGLGLNLQVTLDYRRTLKFCEVVWCDEKKENKLSFREKVRISIQDIFRIRADLHYRACQHKVVKRIEAMLVDALLKSDEHYFPAGYGFKLSNAHTSLKSYLLLTDHIVPEIMYRHESEGDKGNLYGAKSILRRIQTRDLYKEVECWPLAVDKIKWEDIIQLERVLGEDYVVSKLSITNGGKEDPNNPLKDVHFHAKDIENGKCELDHSDDNYGDIPRMHWELPHEKLMLLCTRERCSEQSHDHGEATKRVEKFLTKKEALLARSP